MITIQDCPEFSGLNRYEGKFEKLDIKRQMVVLLDALGRTHLHRNKHVGNLTKKARAYITFQFVEELKSSGFLLKNILNLDQRHLKAVISQWPARKLAAGTITSRLSVLKWLVIAIGKRGMLLPLEEYGCTAAHTARTYVAVHDKSWSTNPLIPSDIFEIIAAEDPWVGLQLELKREFGLRINEVVLLQPQSSDLGTQLKVERGTKGGRTRFVPITKESQRLVLIRAVEMSKLSSRHTMIPHGLTPSQAKTRIYTVCGKYGITKAQLGATPHGLRHEYGNDFFFENSGFASVVRGGPVIRDRLLDEQARKPVTRAMGHSRIGITAAYTGARIVGRPASKKASTSSEN